jgi:hypothetical protein
MTVITHNAQFGPADPTDRILDDIACPGCGYREPASEYRLALGNEVRFFCDGCGAFVTILLTDAQAEVVRGWSSAGTIS